MPCNDISRVVSFYTTVLGWESADPASSPSLPGAMEGTDAVHMFKTGKLSGAFVKMSKPEGVATVADAAHPAKTAVLASFFVASIEETLKKVEDAGGRVHVYVILKGMSRTELMGLTCWGTLGRRPPLPGAAWDTLPASSTLRATCRAFGLAQESDVTVERQSVNPLLH